MSRQMLDQRSHHYGDILVREDGRAHIGDTIIQHYYAPSIQQTKYEALLSSLRFERMDARLLNVAAALPTTCEWLIHHDHFRAWSDVTATANHCGLLWIKGKPGCGKSTIMKETLAWAKREWSSEAFLSYFFNARSPHQLEKSLLGLYRSLLYQLLCARSSPHVLFLTRFASKEKSGAVEEWTEIELQNFFLELATAGNLNSVNLFIDALDEGDDNDIRKLVTFLRRLTRVSASETKRCRVCLSSRHYPHVDTTIGLSIILEDELGHNQDIESYVQDELASDDNSTKQELHRTICQRSAGVFLWVVIVTSMLNKMYDEGKGLTSMLKKLKEVPADLHQIFDGVLLTTSDGFDECEVLLRWVLFSMRPLTPDELYCAVKQSCQSEDAEDVKTFSQERLTRYLLGCSRGLVELSKDDPPVIQFIHETVRDYLLNQTVSRRHPVELQRTKVSLKKFRPAYCNLLLAENCLEYFLNLADSQSLTAKALRNYPLLGYAAQHWYKHVIRSRIHNRRLLELALRLFTKDESTLLSWVQLYDVYGDNLWPDSTTAAIYLDPPLHYAAYIGIPVLVPKMLQQGADVNAWGRTYGTALLAATVRSHEKIVRMLLDAGADVNTQGRIKETILFIASERGNDNIVRMLVDAGALVNITNAGPLGSALRAASRWGYEKIVNILIDAGADVNAQTWSGNSLQIASFCGHSKTVEVLIEAGADVNAGGLFYMTPLMCASLRGYTDIAQTLINAGANVNAEFGGNAGSALRQASIMGHEKVVQILIDSGANVHVKGKRRLSIEGRDAIQLASENGHSRVVEMLTKAASENHEGIHRPAS